MSQTIVDLPKVAQMLDSGWQVRIWKNPLGSYTVEAGHPMSSVMARAAAMLDEDGDFVTDDFTPEQALTRMAYKVFGEIL